MSSGPNINNVNNVNNVNPSLNNVNNVNVNSDISQVLGATNEIMYGSAENSFINNSQLAVQFPGQFQSSTPFQQRMCHPVLQQSPQFQPQFQPLMSVRSPPPPPPPPPL